MMQHQADDMYITNIIQPYRSSQIQYDDKYLLLFSAYNAWYRMATRESIDVKALRAIKLRDTLWGEYYKGECLERLRPLLRRIALLTHLRPLRANSTWNGVVNGPEDYEGLIEFWYAVRCDIVHANTIILQGHYESLVKLAYESLSVYMTEVVLRLQLGSIQQTIRSGETPILIDTPRLDEVDLHPKSYFNDVRNKLIKKAAMPRSKHFTS